MGTSASISADRLRNRAAWISAGASLLIFILKVYAYRLTNSAAVFSDALESIVNVIASLVALYVVRLSAVPADENHPYGHGKAESFSSAFEGGLIFFAAVMIIAESVKALFEQQAPQKLEIGLVFIGLAAFLNLILGLYLRRTGISHQSEALKASGTHVLSDVVTTVAVMVGLGLVLLTGWLWLDPAMAILVGLQLAYSGYKIMRESMGVLMDEQNDEVLTNLATALQKNRRPGIIDIHELRTIRAGRFHHVDAHLVVPEYWDISTIHDLETRFERDAVESYEFDGELAFHVDPCKKSFCSVCVVAECPIRVAPFEEERPFTVKSLTGGPQPTNPIPHDNPANSSPKN